MEYMMNRRILAILIASLFVGSLAFTTACGEEPTDNQNQTDGDADGDTDGDGDGDGDGDVEVISIVDNEFDPDDVTVDVGTTVRWENDGSATHTVTSGADGDHDDEFDSGNLSPDDSFEFTFEDAGTFPYYCTPHVSMGMEGSVTVED